MQSTNMEMDDEVTMMASLLKAMKFEHRIVFEAEKTEIVRTGILYKCHIEVKTDLSGSQWCSIESLPALILLLAQKR